MGRRRPPVHRLRRRHRHAQRRPRQPEGRRRDRRAGRALHAYLLPGGDVRAVRRRRRRAQPARAGRVAEEDAAAFDRRRGDRERGQDRARVHAPPGRRRVHPRLSRAHAARALDDRQERAVQTAFRSVLQRDLSRAVPVRTSRGDDASARSQRSTSSSTAVVSPDRVAAIIIEPVLGEGGFVPAPPDFLRELRRIADEHGIVLIADEIQTGLRPHRHVLRVRAIRHRARSDGGGKIARRRIAARGGRRQSRDHGRARARRLGRHVRRQSGRVRRRARRCFDIIDEAFLARARAIGSRIAAALRSLQARVSGRSKTCADSARCSRSSFRRARRDRRSRARARAAADAGRAARRRFEFSFRSSSATTSSTKGWRFCGERARSPYNVKRGGRKLRGDRERKVYEYTQRVLDLIEKSRDHAGRRGVDHARNGRVVPRARQPRIPRVPQSERSAWRRRRGRMGRCRTELISRRNRTRVHRLPGRLRHLQRRPPQSEGRQSGERSTAPPAAAQPGSARSAARDARQSARDARAAGPRVQLLLQQRHRGGRRRAQARARVRSRPNRRSSPRPRAFTARVTVRSRPAPRPSSAGRSGRCCRTSSTFRSTICRRCAT